MILEIKAKSKLPSSKFNKPTYVTELVEFKDKFNIDSVKLKMKRFGYLENYGLLHSKKKGWFDDDAIMWKQDFLKSYDLVIETVKI